MKLFTEYLLDKNLVSEETLLQMHLAQIAASLSLPELAHQKKILSSKQILEALGHMTHHPIDFKSACRELGFWTPQVQQAFSQEIENLKIPVCRLLLEQGAIELSVLIRALDDYLAQSKSIDPPLGAAPTLAETLPAPVSLFKAILGDDCQAGLERVFAAEKANS